MSDRDKVVHLPVRRGARAEREEALRTVELSIAAHFREQNELLRELNKSLSEKVQRLTLSVERLVAEMNGVRTGDREDAFARVAAADACADLATVKADVANLYPYTSSKIAKMLGFSANQIGQLLGPKGLGWAGNGDYQEMTRWQEGHPRYWHADVPERLRRILSDTSPEDHGIKNRAVVSMFQRWKATRAAQVVDQVADNGSAS